MSIKKLLKSVLISLLIVIFACNGTLAVTFKDQAEIDQMTWAKEAIMEMAEKGIISGMPDGTFKPADNIKKLDCLMLVAKALGSNNLERQAEVDAAELQYKSYLNSYLVYGKREISYLLKKGIIKTEELDDYIGANSAYATMLRYEAAILLVKAMGEEEQAQGETLLVLPFADQNTIPERARPYVAYLYKQDIMKGTSATEFSPFLPVSRAQMAVLLYKASAKIEEKEQTKEVEKDDDTEDVTETIDGVITDVQADLNLIKVKNNVGGSQKFYLISSAEIIVDGDETTIEDLFVRMDVTLTLENNEVVKLVAEKLDIEQTEEGIVSSVKSSGVAKIIKIRVVDEEDEDEYETKQYTIGQNVEVVKDGKKTSNSSIKTGDYAIVELDDDGEVYRLVLTAREQEVEGIVVDVITELPASITIKDKNKLYTYELTSDFDVRRNKKTATIWDIRTGDEVTLVLEYDKVIEIIATGDCSTVQGTIEEVLISRNPQITIRNKDGELEEFEMSVDTEVEIGEEEKTFYDLRVGHKVTLRLESDVVATVLAEEAKQAVQVTGTVNQINESIGVITITPDKDDSSGISQIYFPHDKTVRIINAFTGKNESIRDLEKGVKITAFGYNDMGIFVTTQIIIISE